MSASARKELYATIEQQKELISKYESKIRDLVRAYKSLAKENDALQVSLTAIAGNEIQKEKLDQPAKGETENLNSSADDVDEESKAKAARTEELKNKVTMLTASLQTLTTERNRTETSLKEDRKRILEEKQKVEMQLKIDKEEWMKLQKDYETKLQELRNRIIVCQHEREQEASNGVMMLREVESHLSKERNEREKIEKMLDDTREQNRQFILALGTKTQEKKQQKQITDLQNELEQVRCRLKKAEEQCMEPPMLKKLQEQMEEMKTQYTEAMLQEKLRAESAEKSAKEMSQLHEERVASLEARLTELSVMAARYDRTRQTHLQTIHNLKEKIAELSEANVALSCSKSSSTSTGGVQSRTKGRLMGETCDTNTLIENLVLLWEEVQTRQKYETAYNMEEFLSNSEIIHSNCIAKYKELEKEIEAAKERTRLDSSSSNYCTCGLKELLHDARERIRSVNAASHTTQLNHNRQVMALKEEMKQLRLKYEEQISHLERDQRVLVNNLEQQLAEHCQRSLITLQDRDEEIHRLSHEIYRLNKEAEAQPMTVAAALLSQVSTGGSDGPLLHHLEEIARKELEVSGLRREKILLERSMREIQMTSIDKQQMLQETIDDLREEVERLKRNSSREGENLEYLKNVVLQYMTSCDVESRTVILNAIAAVLKFTSQETESVKRCLALWWWQAPTRNKSLIPKVARSPSVTSTSELSIRDFHGTKNTRSRYFSEND